jgi:hypothetical protein
MSKVQSPKGQGKRINIDQNRSSGIEMARTIRHVSHRLDVPTGNVCIEFSLAFRCLFRLELLALKES